MALPTKLPREPRNRAITLRVTDTCYDRLVELAGQHGLSQADVLEHLVEQEHAEHKRLKGKPGRYKHSKTAATTIRKQR